MAIAGREVERKHLTTTEQVVGRVFKTEERAADAGDTAVERDLLPTSFTYFQREIDRQGGPTAPGLELPEAHIRGDVNTPYRCIGGAIYTMQRAGFARVGFISEPPAGFVSQRF